MTRRAPREDEGEDYGRDYEYVPGTERPERPEQVPSLVAQFWPLAWMPFFLLAIRETANVRMACEAAGVSRRAALDAKERNPEFAAVWEEALEEAFDRLEGYAWRRALSGTKSGDELLWRLLQSYRRDQFGEKVKIEIRAFEREAQRLADAHDLDPDEMIALAREIANSTNAARLTS